MHRLGVIADDFTGATDIAGFLATNGVATIQTSGIPEIDLPADADAFVISLKSRSCPKEKAISDSLAALEWLQANGCDQIYFKYCSTFDSTPKGNIGPVTDALMEAMSQEITVLCPALPVNGRTVYKGYLFVHEELLNESGMRNHPLNPMTDAKISRVMESQAKGRAFNIYVETIERGPEALSTEFSKAKREGYHYVVVDTLSEGHLDIVGAALKDLPLLTGGSGLAASLAKLSSGRIGNKTPAISAGRPEHGKGIIFSGSCSTTTVRQVAHYRQKATTLALDIDKCLNDSHYNHELFQWVSEHIDEPYAPLLYATTSPRELAEIKSIYAGHDVGAAIERVFGDLAVALKRVGVRNFIVAGGETSGMIVQSLGLTAFHIGPQIDPGVPWVKAVGEPLYLALKSGNFGADDFFSKAQEKYL